MQTTMKLNTSERLSCAIWWIRHSIRRMLGKMPATAQTEYEHLRDKHAGVLSAERQEEIRDYQRRRVGADYKRRSALAVRADDPRPLRDQPMQNRCAAFVAQILKDHPDILCVANIGARVDVATAHLAPQFPGISFTSVDLQEGLAQHNSELPQSPNWSFVSGYMVDLFKSGQFKADLIFSTSTAVLFNSVEVDKYFEAAKEAGIRYIALNEGWWPQRLRVPTPESLGLDDPVCGGTEADYMHNFPGKLERAGFEVISAEVSKAYMPGMCVLQVLAKARI